MTPETNREEDKEGRPADSVAEGEQVQEALLRRPRFTIRVRIIIIFIVIFVLVAGTAVTTMTLISKLRAKSEFLEGLDCFAFELQQARRFEKNYFIYGTDLSEALDHLHTARSHFKRDAEQVELAVSQRAFSNTREGLDRYEALLEQLFQANMQGEPSDSPEQRKLHAELRKHGAQLLSDAQALVEDERLAMHSMLDTIAWASAFFLVLIAILMSAGAAYISSAVLKPLRRFMEYASRIGRGDYSPIKPARKYRDEFTELGIAVNRMLGELQVRQEQLMQTKKMAAVGSLTSGVAHELNNPLNNIGITIEALLEDFENYSDEKKLQMLEQAYTQVERASSTVRTLLDFTRKEQPTFASVNILRVIETTVKLASNELTLGEIELDLQLPGKLPTIMGNPRNLQQVFLNLFLNSIHAMDRGGKLTVRGAEEDEFVRVDVADTGRGIPKENLDRIFEPFFSTKDPGEGTGLGLPVSFGIVEKHHGRLIVESEVGQGTTFSVFLPIKSQRQD